MDESAYLKELSGKPLGTRVRGYMKLAGPGYLQSAMTLGGGSIAGAVTTASLLGYELLWVAPMAIVLGYFVMASIGKIVTNSGEKPYDSFCNRLHPAMAILWGGSALIATVLWHIPQYGLTANGAIVLGEGIGLDLDTKVLRGVIGAVCLGSACVVLSFYSKGARGLKIYETIVKVLVWSIVLAFAAVCFSTGIDIKRLILGITGISFLQDFVLAEGIPEASIKPIVGSIAAAVGINMVFLYPYSILNKGWGKEHKELAYYDLLSGMVLPFLLATTLMMLAVANTIGPVSGQMGEAVRDMREIIPVLEPTLGARLGSLLVGLGMFAVGFSTIITHMLASGFIGCELFGFDYKSRAKLWFSLLPAIGVVGVMIQFPWAAAVTASTLAAPLLPVTVIGFIILLNRPSFMGEAMPRGAYRFVWNFFLIASVLVMGVASFFSLQKNWVELVEYLKSDDDAVQAASFEVNSIVKSTKLTAENSVKYIATDNAMGTEFTFTLYADNTKWGKEELRTVADEAFQQIHNLEGRISTWIDDSIASEINRHAADHPVSVDDDTLALLLTAKKIHADTEGVFDVTVGPLVELWRKCNKDGRMPTDAELKQARANVGLAHVEIDEQAGAVTFTKPGIRLDFGGIGKGLALDKAAEIFRNKGITNALLDSGSSTVLALGAPPDRDAWVIGLKDMLNLENDSLAEIELRDAAYSTSAGFENYREIAANEVSHIFDPRTGQPVSTIYSASAIGTTGILCDALSTAFYVLGEDGTRKYCAQHPEMRAILAIPDGEKARVVKINFV